MSGHRGVGRRGLIGGASMLILVAAEAGVAKAEELDGELLQAAADFHRLRAQDKAFWKTLSDDPGNVIWDQHNAPDGRWTRIDEAADRVAELPAKTPEGLRAKATVVEALMIEHHGEQLEEGCEDEQVRLAMSLACDVLGKARA